MPNVYARMTKIKNAVGRSQYMTDDPSFGRSDYISGKSGRQEEVVVDVKHMHYPWEFYQSYESEHAHQVQLYDQNVAREIVIALPNELAGQEKGTTTDDQKARLTEICEGLAKEIIGTDHDYECAVHWNHDRTNLHCHLMFSERRVNEEAKPKTYKKDIWTDPVSHKLMKAGAPGAVLAHRKGEIMHDADGSIRYDTAPLSAKDPRFKQKSFMRDRNLAIQKVMDQYGYHLDIQDKSSPYLSQRKLYKYANSEYKKAAAEYNSAVKEYNANVHRHLEIEPEKRKQYCEIRSDVEEQVRKDNSREKKISERAVAAIRYMAEKVQSFIADASHKIRTDVAGWWQEHKKAVLSAFESQLDETGGSKYVDNFRTRSSENAFHNEQTERKDLSDEGYDRSPDSRSAGERLTALRSSNHCGNAASRAESDEVGSERKRVITRKGHGVQYSH